jgi:hypothetical protein
LWTWFFTVGKEIVKVLAISRLDMPRASRAAISLSRGVSLAVASRHNGRSDRIAIRLNNAADTSGAQGEPPWAMLRTTATNSANEQFWPT